MRKKAEVIDPIINKVFRIKNSTGVYTIHVETIDDDLYKGRILEVDKSLNKFTSLKGEIITFTNREAKYVLQPLSSSFEKPLDIRN